MSRGETAMLLCDTGVSEGDDSVTVPFLGRALRATVGAAWLARRSGAAVLPLSIAWSPDGGHHLRIEPAVQVGPLSDEEGYVAAVVTAVHAVLERRILDAPSQWFKWKDLHDMSTPSAPVTTSAEPDRIPA